MSLYVTLFRIVVASILSRLISLVTSLILNVAVTDYSAGAQFAVSLAIELVCIISFAIVLTCLLHVYNSQGEGEVWEDYPEKYHGILRDIPLIVKKEIISIIAIFTVSGVALLLMIINRATASLNILYTASMLLGAASLRVYLFSVSNPLFCLISAASVAITCVIYVIIYALFRWKWRRFM